MLFYRYFRYLFFQVHPGGCMSQSLFRRVLVFYYSYAYFIYSSITSIKKLTGLKPSLQLITGMLNGILVFLLQILIVCFTDCGNFYFVHKTSFIKIIMMYIEFQNNPKLLSWHPVR